MSNNGQLTIPSPAQHVIANRQILRVQSTGEWVLYYQSERHATNAAWREGGILLWFAMIRLVRVQAFGTMTRSEMRPAVQSPEHAYHHRACLHQIRI